MISLKKISGSVAENQGLTTFAVKMIGKFYEIEKNLLATPLLNLIMMVCKNRFAFH